MILSVWIEPQKFTYIVTVYLLDMTGSIYDMSPCSLVGNYRYFDHELQAASLSYQITWCYIPIGQCF